MKAIVCEMCSGHDFVKDGDFFVCQSCGTKYSADDAKKMMVEIEGKVDVSGSSVKIDRSEELEKLYALARRAKENNDSENGAKYYAMILEKKPDDWEAAFYSMHFRNQNIKVGEISNAQSRYKSSIKSILQLIKQQVPAGAEQKKAVQEVGDAAVSFWKLTVANLDGVAVAVAQSMPFQRGIFITEIGDVIADEFEGDKGITDIAVSLWKLGEEYTVEQMKGGMFKQYYKQIAPFAEQTLQKIQQQDSQYRLEIPKSGSCYIATCVYGSYDCPQVWTLRRFRDNTLAATWYGRVFIRTYYAISPTLVRLFGETKWFRGMWKKPLDSMVTALRRKGVADTPYRDK